jgi:hypothetical protein
MLRVLTMFSQLAKIRAREICVLYMHTDFTANVHRYPHILCLVESFEWATDILSDKKDRVRVKFASLISAENYLHPFGRNFITRIYVTLCTISRYSEFFKKFVNRTIKRVYIPSIGASCVCITNSHLVLYSRETLVVCMGQVKKIDIKACGW